MSSLRYFLSLIPCRAVASALDLAVSASASTFPSTSPSRFPSFSLAPLHHSRSHHLTRHRPSSSCRRTSRLFVSSGLLRISFLLGMLAAAFPVSAIADNGRLNQLDFDIKGGPPPKIETEEPSEDDLKAITGDDDGGESPVDVPTQAPPVEPRKSASQPAVVPHVNVETPPPPPVSPPLPPMPAPSPASAPAADTSVREKRPAIVPPAAIAMGGAFKVTRYEWERMPDAESHFLTPKLRGPTTDQGNEHLITTFGSWTKGKKGCQEIEDAGELCKKAKALKELFNRFSGDDDFYNSHCIAPCELPDATAVLTGFVVIDTRRGDFKVLEKGMSCQYQLKASAPENRWVALEGKRGVCSCLPTSCGAK